MIHITGNTFPIRERLKELGARWNGDHTRWELFELSPVDRAELQRTPGISVIDTPSQARQEKQRSFDQKSIEELIREISDDDDDNNEPSSNTLPSNKIGDDFTWHNYFADKNPITFFGFSSLATMTKYVKAIPASVRDHRYSGRGWVSHIEQDWFGTDSMDDALSLARHGWPEGVEMAREIVEQLSGRNALQRHRKPSIAGGHVSIGRMLAGDPKHMIARPKQPGKKIVTFFVEAFISSSIDPNNAIVRAAMVAAIVDILEMNGYSCEIISIASALNKTNKPAFQVATTLKAAGETLNLDDIVFALGHPSYFRRMVFACVGSDPRLSEVWRYMGMPTQAFPKDTNEFYIKQIPYNSKIRDNIGLIRHAKAIWRMTTNKALPVELREDDE